MIIRLKCFIAAAFFIYFAADECHADCKAGWQERNDYCYYRSNVLTAWTQAESYCQTQGGHLVSFQDLNERNYVFNTFIAGTGDKYWIGLNDIAFEGAWVWTDKTAINTNVFNWKLNEPNNGGGNEDCVIINDEVQQVTDGNWVDIECRKARKYICKMSNSEVPDCDANQGFIKSGSYCYKYMTEQRNWNDANDICRDTLNAELTAVTSANEQSYIFSLMQTSNVDTWIGLSDSVVPGQLQWSNGVDIYNKDNSYTNWAPNEPAHIYQGSTCIQSSILLTGQWSVAMCGELKPFICRKGLRAVCPSGWIYAHGKCYSVILNSNFFLTWTEANNYCRAKNARLLEIETEEEQTFISAFGSELNNEGILQVWLGISDRGHDDIFTWTDQAPVTLEHWDHNQPTKRAGQDDCARIYTGKGIDNWEIATCYSQQAFVCEVYEGTGITDIEVPDVYYDCPKSWRLLPPFCYFFGDTSLLWSEAEEFCQKPEQGNGHLASIHNSTQQSFIAGHLTKQSWIGLHDHNLENQWEWTDGTVFNFTNWNGGEPNNAAVNEDCAYMLTSGNWNDDPCDRDQKFVCQRDAVHTALPQPVPTLPPNANEILCGDGGYIHNPSSHKCYKFVDDVGRSWADARLHCQLEGGDLASINSPDEQSFVQINIALSARQIAFWIGGLDSWSGPINTGVIDIADGGWRWIDGSPFNYVNWNSGEPNNVNDEDCIEMVTDHGYWNDLKCTDFRGYVCEKEDPDHATHEPATDCQGVDCCYRHLGVEVGGSVRNRQLSASSQQDAKSGPDRGRLNTIDQYIDIVNLGPGRGAWVPNQNEDAPWIQVDLEAYYEVRGVITQGRHGLAQPVNQNMWTRKITVHYNTHYNKETWEPVRDTSGNALMFDANHDQNTQVTNIFDRPVIATGIRITLYNCRLGCALRFEVIGCTPQCANSLGVGADSLGAFPLLPASSFSASSFQTGYEPENSRLDYTESQTLEPKHTKQDSSTLTWTSARQYCASQGADLCSYDEICSTGTPIITGVVSGDTWAPIRDSQNDWVQIGDDDSPQNPGRLCLKHNELYGAPSWGETTGRCEPWAIDSDPCPHKGHVYCCPGNVKCWKPSQSDQNQWLQVDLGEARKVAGVLLQGNALAYEWVTGYKIQFSNDGNSFTTYLTPTGGEQLFPGSENQNGIVEGFLQGPITTRYVRLKPTTWNTNIAVRFDVIGCRSDDLVTCSDTAVSRSGDFTVSCPAGCDTSNAKVWGTGVYTENSYVCAAAVHDGMILADHGGVVDVKKAPGRTSYTGSNKNGVASQSSGSADASFIFQGDHLGCPPGWSGWLDWCYYTPRMSFKLSWQDSRQYCQSYGGDLVSIGSQAEHNFVTSMFLWQYNIDETWIGLNDLNTFHYYEWSDGREVTYTRWDTNEPNYEDERCVEMFKLSGLWNDQKCDDEINLICKMDKVPVNSDQTVIDGCEAGWIAFEGSCYFIDLTRMVWINSENYCKAAGGHLTAITTFAEELWLTSQIAEATHSTDAEMFWIGLGAYLDPSSDALVYQWSTGEAVSFTAWDSGQPNIQHTCSFPFLYEGIERYECIEEGWPAVLLGPWCSADPVFTNHPVACNGWTETQVGCIRMNSVNGLWSQGQPIACASDAYKVCEKPRVGYTNPAPPTTPSANGNCPFSWYGSATSNYCYQINEFQPTKRLNWLDADVYCKSQGAQLVSMHSAQEEQLIASGVQHTSDSDWFWIGMKTKQIGSMGWTDNSPVSYTNWRVGEPNNFNGREECAMAYYGTNGDMFWQDMNCDAAENFICKILRGADLFPPVTPPPGTNSPQICGFDVDWVAYTPPEGTQYCYHFGTEPKGFYEASQFCKGLGGELTSVHSMEEQFFLTGRTSKIDIAQLWIGLYQETVGGYYVWTDESMLVYTNWWGGEPNDFSGQETCVQLYHTYGQWSDANCGLRNGYICKKRVGAQPQEPDPTPTLAGGCPQGWYMYGSKCFLTIGYTNTTMRKSWNDAEVYCNSQGGYLASVPNEYYNAFLTSIMYTAHSTVWIGLNTIGHNRVFFWSDNEAVYYTNWEYNEPNAQGTEECVEMYTSGRWNDKECDAARPFICNRWRSTAYPEPTPDATGCPAGYYKWDTSCYKLYSAVSDQLSWSDARAKCLADGQAFQMTMDLASMWNWYENNYLKAMFWPDADYDYTWIGLYYNHSLTDGQTEFRWSDGSSVYYTNWDSNQPQQINDALGCVEMKNNGRWTLVPPEFVGAAGSCDTPRPFVCKHETLILPPPADPGIGVCDPDWEAFGEYCYFVRPGFSSVDQRSWGDAEIECQKRGGSLTSIGSDIENKVIKTWGAGRNIWIGLRRNAWGGWEWSDTAPLQYVNWKDGEPNDVGETGEQCTEMYRTGYWNDAQCSGLRGYICKKHKSYSHCNFEASERVNCGYNGINEFECLERGCCFDTTTPDAVDACYYSRNDAECLNKGGTCKDFEHNVCTLGYEQNLCSGDNSNLCCFTCDATDDTCNEQVAGWEEGDGPCRNELQGNCRDNSNYCEGTYYSGYCGGPGNRQCCSTQGPATDKPPMTEPFDTESPPQTQGTPGTGPTKPSTTIKETVGPEKTTTRGDVGEPESAGLSGGAIAGIVISVLLIVFGLGVAFYYHRQGGMPSMSAYVPSFGKKSVYDSDVPTSFDNPIMFNKETADVEGLGDDDAGGSSNA